MWKSEMSRWKIKISNWQTKKTKIIFLTDPWSSFHKIDSCQTWHSKELLIFLVMNSMRGDTEA